MYVMFCSLLIFSSAQYSIKALVFLCDSSSKALHLGYHLELLPPVLLLTILLRTTYDATQPESYPHNVIAYRWSGIAKYSLFSMNALSLYSHVILTLCSAVSFHDYCLPEQLLCHDETKTRDSLECCTSSGYEVISFCQTDWLCLRLGASWVGSCHLQEGWVCKRTSISMCGLWC